LIATVSNSGLVSGIGPVDAPVIIAYTITVQGVSNTAYDTLDYVAAPALPIRLPTVDLIKSEPTVLQARPIAVQYNWTPSIWLSNASIVNPTVIANQEVEFNIEMIATNGCKTIDTLTARMFDRADVFLPNMFTPNGDGINDLFKINPVGIQTLNYFRVFNQWGKMIFQTNRLAEGWDGYYDNQLQPLASYNWLLEAIDTKGKLIQKAGTVTLIR
jgi:gliding motility-associated-like protein